MESRFGEMVGISEEELEANFTPWLEAAAEKYKRARGVGKAPHPATVHTKPKGLSHSLTETAPYQALQANSMSS
jgi:hypothetical protein